MPTGNTVICGLVTSSKCFYACISVRIVANVVTKYSHIDIIRTSQPTDNESTSILIPVVVTPPSIYYNFETPCNVVGTKRGAGKSSNDRSRPDQRSAFSFSPSGRTIERGKDLAHLIVKLVFLAVWSLPAHGYVQIAVVACIGGAG